MRILGIEVVDPSDAQLVESAVKDGLHKRVIRPCEILISELDAGARPSTAFWLLNRFVLPNAVFYAQAWGLLGATTCWSEADAALDRICERLAPADLRANVPALRRELALPQRRGGLGIPVLATASAHMAASQQAFQKHRDAVKAGMRPDRAALAFARDRTGVLSRGEMVPVGLEVFYDGEEAAIEAAVPQRSRAAWKRRREQNKLRAGMWAFNSVPWEAAQSLNHAEWDVLWRLVFGGLSEEARASIDQPPRGFVFRGTRVEHAVQDAILDVLPPGAFDFWHQPSPELTIPLDHVARCTAARVTLDGWKRADITAEFAGGAAVTLDVRTVHLQAASALQRPVASQISSIENEKTWKYSAYYSRFKPFVISLTGAVSDTAFGAIAEIARHGSRASGPRLKWEQERWAVAIVQRVAIATVKAAAWEATRVPNPVRVPFRARCRAECPRVALARC